MAGSTKSIDWDAIEPDYSAGFLSLREVSAKHSTGDVKVSHVAIAKHAERFGWTRNLQGKIQAKAEALIARAEVNAANAVSIAAGHKPIQQATEREIIEVNAARIAQVRGEHRADITRARSIVNTMFDKLEIVCGDKDAVGRLRELVASGNAEMIAAATKQMVIEEPLARGLIQSLGKLVELERQAYGVDKNAPPEGADPDDIPPIDRRELARQVAFMFARATMETAA